MKRGKSQTTLDVYVKKVKGCVSKVQLEHSCDASFVTIGECSTSPNDVSDMDNTSSRHNDVGCYIDSFSNIGDLTKYGLLMKTWRSPRGYALPFSTHREKGKDEKRYLNQTHLDKFLWLVYSEVRKGLFCK